MSKTWRHIVGTLSLAGIVGGWAFPGSAQAASFDCGQARSKQELFICADPGLSDLDARLGRLYQERRALLSQQGSLLLQKSERSWLHFVVTVCPLGVPADSDSRREPKNCMAEEYRERLTQIANAGKRLGPFIFNRIDLYSAKPASDETGGTPGFLVQHVAYPQIDNANGPQIALWNKKHVKNLTDPGDCIGDGDTDYIAGYANDRLISIEWINSLYCHGTPHGMFGITNENLLLPSLEPLAEEDVFGPDDRWVKKLQDQFWIAYRKNQAGPSSDRAKRAMHEVNDDIIDADNWLFESDGLKITFNEGVGGCYACTPSPVTITWSALKPLLSPSAVVP